MKRYFENGIILTMESEEAAEALLIEDGRILAAGTRAELEQLCDRTTERTDLAGMTLMPGFIDGHSHVTSVAQTFGMVNLTGAASFDEIARRMAEYKETHPLGPGKWLVGFGYDHNTLREKRHPDAAFLDAVEREHPVMISHASFHMGAVNHAALKLLEISADTPDPEGGRIGRLDGTGKPSGYLEEGAFMFVGEKIPAPTVEELKTQIQDAEQYYFSYGITTIQDGMTSPGGWSLLRAMAKEGRLTADFVAYADIRECGDMPEKEKAYRDYQGHLKFGGFKLFLDGSPQGRTAWMLTPYLGKEKDYRGYPIHSDETVRSYVQKSLDEGVQLLTHCNGDAAAEQLIRAFEEAEGKCADIRPVMIHAQLVQKGQLERMARLGMIASFFVAHVYHWGDVHAENFGPERAASISQVRTALEAGVVCDFHQDAPVIPPDMLETVWCAVNRQTRAGRRLGPEFAVTPFEALEAVTKNAAYAYFEEAEKGTLAPGKKADLVILDQNPLECPAGEIRDIRVMETIKDGKTVFRRTRKS